MYMDKLQQRPHCDVTGMTVSRGNYPNNFLISSIQVHEYYDLSRCMYM
jgi:hypothetical protein